MPRRVAVHVSKLCLLIFLATITYNEYLCYWLHYRSWPRLPPSTEENVAILLVADPQILGEDHEPSGVLGTLRRWDGDRYLHKSYRWAVSGYSIDTVVFLGDLADEASEADGDQLERYAARFHSIYDKEEGKSMIYLPGDNDIGGEGGDPVTLSKIVQFEKHFGPSAPVHHVAEWLDIAPISRLTEHGVFNLTQKPSLLSPSKMTIAVSHLPVLPLNGRFAERVIDLVSPDLVVSAHDHRGYLFTASRETRRQEREVERFDKRNLNVPFTLQTRTRDGSMDLSSLVWEVVVPTCSYRMGVQEMGLGLMVVSKSGETFYANLWLPGRFSLLYTYAACLAMIIAILSVKRLVEWRRQGRKKEKQQTWKK